MAKHKVSDFYIEMGFDDTSAMKGLQKFESEVVKVAERIKKSLTGAMKLPPFTGGLGMGGFGRPSSGGTGRPPRSPSGSGDPLGRRNGNIDTAVANQMYSGLTRQMDKYLGKGVTDLGFRKPLQELADRFKSDNTKTYADFRKEMNKLTNTFKEDIARRKEQIRDRKRGEWMQDRSTNSFKQMLGTAVTSFAIADQIQKAIQVGMDRQRREIASQSVYGEQNQQAKDNARRLAMTYGQGYNETLRQQTSFAAGAMPSMGYEGSQKFFEQAMSFATVRGLGKDEMQGVMRAFEQMASKGKIQAEELRGQLGDRMAGAFQMFAAAMGVTTQELDNMMKKGEVLSDKVLPKVGNRMEQLAKENGALADAMKSPQVASGQLTYALEEARDAFWKNDFKRGYVEITQSLTQMLLTHREVFQDIGDMFGDLMSAIADFIGYLDEKIAHVRGYWGLFLDDMYYSGFQTAAKFLDENDGWLLFFAIFGKRLLALTGLVSKFKDGLLGIGAAANYAASSTGLIALAELATRLAPLASLLYSKEVNSGEQDWIDERNKKMVSEKPSFGGSFIPTEGLPSSLSSPMTMQGSVYDQWKQDQMDFSKQSLEKNKDKVTTDQTPFPPYDDDAYRFWKEDQIKSFGNFAQGGFGTPSQTMTMTNNITVVTPDGKKIAEQVVSEQVPLMIDKRNELQVQVGTPYNDF